MKSSKPIIHGTDHLPGHSDPVPLELAGYIRFNHDNLELPTRWLDITTNDADPDGWGMQLIDTSAGGIIIDSVDTEVLITNSGAGAVLISSGGGIDIQATASATLEIHQDGSSGLEITDNSGNFLLIHETGAGTLDIINDGGGAGRLFIQNNGSGGLKIEETGGNGGVIVRANGTSPLDLDQNGDGGLQIKNNGSGQLQISQSGTGGMDINNFGGGMTIIARDQLLLDAISGGNVQARVGSGHNFQVVNQTPTERFRVDDAGDVFMFNLPTSAPGTTGQLWNSSGTLKIV